ALRQRCHSSFILDVLVVIEVYGKRKT
ncbi:hypothetical protein EVA_09279, partial [gut metagenome]